MGKQCKKCSVDLVVDVNWRASSKKYYSYKCKDCCNKEISTYRKNNPAKMHQYNKVLNAKEGLGVYQVMLDKICIYVGEGLIRARRKEHLEYLNPHCSSVYKYCLKHNINRKLLSFNVLEYEDDTDTRKQKEDWYITFLTPVINPKPPLGLYV